MQERARNLPAATFESREIHRHELVRLQAEGRMPVRRASAKNRLALAVRAPALSLRTRVRRGESLKTRLVARLHQFKLPTPSTAHALCSAELKVCCRSPRI
jgi:hypothetical protein